MTVTIYHNPHCSKCRLTMEILETNHASPDTIEYLKTPPSKQELENILTMLNMEPRDLMRKHEVPYKENNLDDASLSREALIEAMISHPILIERPIVVRDGKAIIARPPEKVLEII